MHEENMKKKKLEKRFRVVLETFKRLAKESLIP